MPVSRQRMIASAAIQNLVVLIKDRGSEGALTLSFYRLLLANFGQLWGESLTRTNYYRPG